MVFGIECDLFICVSCAVSTDFRHPLPFFVMFQIKTDHTEPLQTSLFTAPPIPRITVKLEPPSQSTASASKATIKAETSAVYV